MKSRKDIVVNMELRINPKKKCALCGLLGLFLTVLGFATIVLDPIGRIIKESIKLKEGSNAHDLWKKVPVEITLNAYFFNVTNAKEFLSGKDSALKLQEVGPYVFKESRENLNITFNENGTMTYRPKTTSKSVLELSVGDTKVDRIITPNIPLLGMLSTMAKQSFFQKAATRTFLWPMNAEPFLNLTIDEFMWGYEDRLVRVLKGLLPDWFRIDKFGIFQIVYPNHTSVATISLNESSKDLYSIETWNGQKGLPQWGYVNETHNLPCNTVKGTYEGLLFPPDMQKEKPLKIFNHVFCRWLQLTYDRTVEVEYGVRAFAYELSANNFNCTRPENECFCPKTSDCLPDGLSDVTPCYFGLPAAISSPHFLGGDSILFHKLEGLKPDVKRHHSTVMIQPDLGMPVKMWSRTQLNLVMHDISYEPKYKALSNMVLPLLWMDGVVEELPGGLMFRVALALKYLPLAQLYASWALVVLGIVTFVYQLVTFVLMCVELSGIKAQCAMNYNQVPLADTGHKEELQNKLNQRLL